jgi:mRNA-degrading endonuclease YafQ of YafQ-DinJ toxin-antitoxin module
MQIFYSSKFKSSFTKLNFESKDQVLFREKIFRSNPFHKSLKTHKLSGKYKDFWSFSVDYRYRIMFSFESSDTVVFCNVGDHSIYK